MVWVLVLVSRTVLLFLVVLVQVPRRTTHLTEPSIPILHPLERLLNLSLQLLFLPRIQTEVFQLDRQLNMLKTPKPPKYVMPNHKTDQLNLHKPRYITIHRPTITAHYHSSSLLQVNPPEIPHCPPHPLPKLDIPLIHLVYAQV